MQLVHQCDVTGLRVLLIRGLVGDRDAAERELLDAGAYLPLSHRAVWAANLLTSEPMFLLVRDAAGKACAGIGFEKVATRSMPGHAIFRVGRFGGTMPIEACRVILVAISKLAKSIPRILKIQVNVFSRNGREAIGTVFKELGFREVRPPSSYRYSLAIDLRPSEDEIFAAFGKSARKRVRETIKMSLRSETITDPAYAGRMKQLQEEALKRTGGLIAPENWQGILRLSREHPDLSQVFGLFQTEDVAPDMMGAFAWVCNHGNHAEYRASGSQSRGEVRIPFGYLLVWNMVRWSKATGAEWFDMGGVTLPEDGESAFEGISEFKRFFTQEVVEVGAEWVLEPSPVRARIAGMISDRGQRVRAWTGKRI